MAWNIAIGLLHKISRLYVHHGIICGTSLRDIGRPILAAKATTRSWLAEFDDSAYMAQHNYIRPSPWSVRSHVASVGIQLAIGQQPPCDGGAGSKTDT